MANRQVLESSSSHWIDPMTSVGSSATPLLKFPHADRWSRPCEHAHICSDPAPAPPIGASPADPMLHGAVLQRAKGHQIGLLPSLPYIGRSDVSI